MNVLISIDFSQITSVMLESVPSLLRVTAGDDLHIYLVHAGEPEPDFVGWEAGPDVVRDQMADEFHRAHKQLEDLADGLRKRTDAKVTPLLVQGPIAETVCEQAEKLDAAIVVVGSHGHGPAYDLVVGGISSAIIKNSKRPVLIVPAGMASEA